MSMQPAQPLKSHTQRVAIQTSFSPMAANPQTASSVPSTPRSPSVASSSSASSSSRSRRVHISLPKPAATAAAFPDRLTLQSAQETRQHYVQLVTKSATSEALLKMPNISTKPSSSEDGILSPLSTDAPALLSSTSSVEEPPTTVLRLPKTAPSGLLTNMRVTIADGVTPPPPPLTTTTAAEAAAAAVASPLVASSSSPLPSPAVSSPVQSFPTAFPPGQRPGLDRKRSSQIPSSPAQEHDKETEMQPQTSRRSSTMNPNAASFTPTLQKPTLMDCAASDRGDDQSQSGQVSHRASRRNTVDSRDAVVAGLGISSPNSQHPHQFGHGHSSSFNSPSTTPRHPHHSHYSNNHHHQHQGLTVNTKAMSPRHDRTTFAAGSPMLASAPMTAATSATTTTTTMTAATAAEFNPEEFRMEMMRQISDKLESGLSQIVSASMPLSPATSDKEDEQDKAGGSSSALGDDDGASSSSVSTATATTSSSTSTQLKRALRMTTLENDRLKTKNQELLEDKHSLELQRVDLQHTVTRLQDQVTRLQDLEMNNQFLLSRVKELESSRASSSLDSLETGSATNGHSASHHHHHNHSHSQSYQQQQNGSVSQSQLIQRLTHEVAALSAERDQLKIRQWQQQGAANGNNGHGLEIRSAHYVALENERNRLVDELGAKTVAMESLISQNEDLDLRSDQYKKRVWELERQCVILEDEAAQVARIRADLVEMEARAVAADALVEKLQDMEGQVTLIKNLQDRIDELETTNAELDHANWDLTEKLNIANNQHLLLAKEFENFRSKDKDDRQLQFLMTRIRELEQQIQERTQTQPDYKDEYERISKELEKLRVKVPQLEGQAKQVSLMRNKIMQLEKQIKTMEEMEPRLAEMQHMHERNLFLENELGELEMLRARELELETQVDELKARVAQLDQNKLSLSRMNSFRQQQQHGRARSGSMAPLPLSLQLHQQQQQQLPETLGEELMMTTSSPLASPSLQRTLSSSQKMTDFRPMSFEAGMPMATSPKSPKASNMSTVSTASAWPSGRSSMSLTTNRMSTSSSTSSHNSSTSLSMASVSTNTTTTTTTAQQQQQQSSLTEVESTMMSTLVSSSSSSSLVSTPVTENMDEMEHHHEDKENQAPTEPLPAPAPVAAPVLEQPIVA
ncbi:hypothetical protein DFQ26_004313 [Actinomortierella ambigua]|nr:hypothetical protein DFQ26_004313 [Actinomortierella ambigua]